MGLLSRLKALLGLGTKPAEPTRRDNVDVTIERTPKQAAEPDTETEAAVKGVEETPPAEPEPEPVPDEEPEAEPEPEPEPEPASVIEEAESGAADEAEAEEPEAESEPEKTEPESEPEPEPEPEEADEEPRERVAVDEIKGIGPSYAERLSEAGVEDATALAAADADELAEETDISAKRLGRWIERAKNR